MEEINNDRTGNMGKLKIKIDWCDNNYAAAPESETIACIATGRTLTEVKTNLKEALEFHRDGIIEDHEDLPFELIGDIEFECNLTARAILKHSDLFISRKALATASGINEQQLSHYANGYRHAKPATIRRIAAGIQAISDELSMLS